MIALFQCAHAVERGSDALEDRVGVVERDASVVVTVANGAGGSGGGAEAAEAVIAAARRAVASQADTHCAATWCAVLHEVDQNLSVRGVGETTAVVVSMNILGVAGASVSDSGAWLIGPDSYRDLTENQHRKPLVGSGVASPVPFEVNHTCSLLLAATDGLLKCASDGVLLERARQPDLDRAVAHVVDAVRLKSGNLQDDVGVVLARLSRSPGSRIM